jgi:hypothetical protein
VSETVLASMMAMRLVVVGLGRVAREGLLLETAFPQQHEHVVGTSLTLWGSADLHWSLSQISGQADGHQIPCHWLDSP